MNLTKTAFLLAALAVLAAGCPAPSVDLISNGGVVLNAQPSDDFYFESVHVYQQADKTVIEGRLRGKKHDAVTTGHLDATVFGPGGDQIASGNTRLIHRRHQGHGHSEYTFRLELDLVLPEQAVVRLMLHTPEVDLDHGAEIE